MANDDWQGADMIACHIDGQQFLKIQLKARLTFDKKYIGKYIFIAFSSKGNWYLYDHDELMNIIMANNTSKSWSNGSYSWKDPTKNHRTILINCIL